MNYFELYNIPVSFLPNQKQLKQKFYELSRKYHPDFYTQENDFEKSEALEQSSQVNKAYRIFQNQDETIKYVLQEKGLLEEEEKYELPPDFLMEMLELNEQLTEARMEADESAIADLKETIKKEEEKIYLPVKAMVENYEDGKTTNDDLLKVKEYYFKKKYLNRILATI